MGKWAVVILVTIGLAQLFWYLLEWVVQRFDRCDDCQRIGLRILGKRWQEEHEAVSSLVRRRYTTHHWVCRRCKVSYFLKEAVKS